MLMFNYDERYFHFFLYVPTRCAYSLREVPSTVMIKESVKKITGRKVNFKLFYVCVTHVILSCICSLCIPLIRQLSIIQITI